MPVQVVILNYLDKLKKQEGQKPLEKQLRVPNLTQLAGAIDVSRTAYSEYVHDKGTNISRHLTSRTIRVLRNLGHPTKLTDVLEYIEE